MQAFLINYTMEFMNNTLLKIGLTTTLFFYIFTGCQQAEKSNPGSADAVVIKEAFQTQRDEGDNVDSPAVWHGPDGQHWLLATAKEGDVIVAFDATDGSLIRRFGESGSGSGQFERPNGIAVIDDLVLVVERDNQRIQVFTLPGFEPLGYLTHEDIRLPYGLTVFPSEQGNSYELYMTDNFNPALEGYPPQGELDERVHHFRFGVSGDSLQSEHVQVFGDITGEGVLHKVESLFADPTHNRLLIADEAFNQRSVKVYDLAGNFTGKVIPNQYFTSEPEGIALYSCSDGSGYWIMTDQHESSGNKFQVFDRQTLEYVGTFKGEITRNTDGIWLAQQSFGGFPQGAFYPVHDDGSVTAIDWQLVMEGLNLSTCN